MASRVVIAGSTPVKRAASQRNEVFRMNRFALLSLVATVAAWILIRNTQSPKRIVPVKEAAAKLQQAWADHHTTA